MRALVLALLFCFIANSAFGIGGVGVGNGDSCYTAAAGFTIRYSTRLQLKVKSKDSFALSNANLILTEQRPSSISFVVTRDEVVTLGDLATFVAKEYAGKTFAALKQPGAQGLYWENRTALELNGIYLLLTSNGDLVKVTVQANADGDGISMIEPIVRSIAYDTSAPVVSEMHVQSTSWIVGTKQKIFVQMTDDYSGVALVKPDFIWFSNGAEKRVTLISSGSESNLKSEGGDLYSFEIEVNPYAPPGDYTLDSVDFSDQAGNSVQLYTSDKSITYRQGNEPNPHLPVLPVVKVQVLNPGVVDITAPKLLALKTLNKIWKTGSTYRVYFQIFDKESGYDTTWFSTLGSGASSTFAKNGRHFYFWTATVARDEGRGWYSVEVKVPDYLPSGEYQFPEFQFTDKAGNADFVGLEKGDTTYYHEADTFSPPKATKVKILKVQVQNQKAEDVTAPAVSDYRIDSVIAAGGEGRFYFRATDDISGIPLNNAGSVFIYGDPATNDEARSIASYTDSVRREGNDWYSFGIKISRFAKPGAYYVGVFELRDRARNLIDINCIRKPECLISEKTPAHLPKLTLQIIR